MTDWKEGMVVKTKQGKPVTDEMLDKWADAFEQGKWPDGKTVILGRPRLATEEIQSVTIKLPKSKVLALEEKAERMGYNRSEAVREAIDDYLAHA